MDFRGRFKMPLRYYQVDYLTASDDAWSRGVRRQLGAMGTGAGKSVVFRERVRTRPGRSIVLVHRDELATQAMKHLNAVMPGRFIGRVQANLNQIYADVIVASIQTLAVPGRLSQLPGFGHPKAFNTIIADEAHHAVADSWVRALNLLGAFEPQGPMLFGVTATPDRADGKGLNSVFQEIIYEKNLVELIAEGFLCRPRALRVYLGIDLVEASTGAGGDYTDSSLVKIMEAGNSPELIAKALSKHAPDRKSLLFLPSVDLAYSTAAACKNAGFAAEALDGESRPGLRASTLERFTQGEIQVLVNCSLFGEGIDLPAIDC